MNSIEDKILDSVSQHIQNRISTLEKTKNHIDGFENWFQVEVIHTLRASGLEASIKGKVKNFDADALARFRIFNWLR